MNLLRIVNRDITKEFHVSRNLGETRWQGLVRAFLCCLCLIKAFCIGVRWTFHEVLGSQVVYDGRKCFISNWARSEHPSLADGNGFYKQYVPRDQIRSVLNAKEIWHRFSSGVNFYTGYHMNNDINKRLYPAAFRDAVE
jgi:hypothetical protein